MNKFFKNMNQIIKKLSEYILPDNMYTDNLEWLEDLIKCPSQCSFHFQYRGKYRSTRYELYLRWRHEDPWIGALIAYPGDCEDSIWLFLDDMPAFAEADMKKAETWMLEWLWAHVETGRDLMED